MKKLVFASVCALVTTNMVMAQGLINWGTTPGANFFVQTNAQVYSPFFGGGSTGSGTIGNLGPGAAGAGFYETMLYGSQNTTGVAVGVPSTLNALLSAWNTTGLYATNRSSQFSAGELSYESPNNLATLPWGGNTDANGQSNNIIMAGWSANLGLLGNGQETWQNVTNVLANWLSTYTYLGYGTNYFFGVSDTGFLVGNDPPAPGVIWFGPNQTGNGLPIYQPSGNPQFLYELPELPEPGTLALTGLGLLLMRRRK